MNRRFFLLAAPAIVAAPNLMKISALVMPPASPILEAMDITFNELVSATLRARAPFISENIRLANRLAQHFIEITEEQDSALSEMSGISSLMLGAQTA